MTFIKENNIYLSRNRNRKMFNLNTAKIEEVELDSYQTEDNLCDFVDYNERILSLLKFLNNFDGKVPKIYGRLYKNNGKNKILQKELYSYDEEELDKCLYKIYGDLFVELIILDESVDIQKVMEFGKMNKIKLNIFYFHDIEDNDIYLSSKILQKIYIPSYIINIANKDRNV